MLTLRAAGKAMELFLESLATKAAAEAKKRKSKMLTAAHLCVSANTRVSCVSRSHALAVRVRSKAAVNADSMFDFLKDTVAKAPDLPPAAEGGASDDDAAEGAKPKRVRKPRRVGSLRLRIVSARVLTQRVAPGRASPRRRRARLARAAATANTQRRASLPRRCANVCHVACLTVC